MSVTAPFFVSCGFPNFVEMKPKHHLLFLFLFLAGINAHAQDFLDTYVGSYKGTLHLLYPNGSRDSVTFELQIQPTEQPGHWTHTVRYIGETGTIGQVKDYVLVIDSARNDGTHYILDEKDGILITETRIDHTLYSLYMVDGMSYAVTTSFYTNYIDYELSCYQLQPMRSSESEPDEENVRWKVDSFQTATVQKGRLFKQ